MTNNLCNLGALGSLVTEYLADLRNVHVQGDRLRFRRNLERLGGILGYEVSKVLPFTTQTITTPLGAADVPQLTQQPVVCSILRAGLGLHEGVLGVFDRADNAFISAYRAPEANGTFSVKVEYLASPRVDGRVVLMCDPMLATGTSMVLSLGVLERCGKPAAVHILCVVATPQGIAKVHQAYPHATIWTCAIDPHLDSRSYIVPGLGDAGDLAFGEKLGGE